MEPAADESRTLRRTMRDLVALSALPAVWAGLRPLQVAEGLADVLRAALRLDLVYIRLDGQTQGQGIEVARTAGGTDKARDIGRALAPWLDGADLDAMPLLANPVGPGTVRVVAVPIGCGRQDGVLVAGSRQTAFPSEEERLLLNVAANQAAAALRHERDEEALRESEECYRSVIAAMQEGVVLLGADGCIRACNASAERILGLSAEQVRGRTTFDPRWQAIHEDGSPFPGETHPVPLTLRTGRPCSHVVMGVRKPSGQLTWLSINSQPLFRADESTPYAVVASFSDITQRKHTEQALRESEQRWRSLTEALPQLVWSATPDGTCDYFSAQWTEHTGVAEAELLGWRWLATLHPEDREPTRLFWLESVAGRHPYDVEYRVRRRDGEYRWFKTRGVPIRDGGGNIVKWFGTCTDITDLRRAEEALRQAHRELEKKVAERTAALRESETKLEEAQRIAHVGYWDRDLDTDLVTWSDETYRIFGLRPSERNLTLAQVAELIHPDDRPKMLEAVGETLQGGARYDVEYRAIRPNGEVRIVHSQGSITKDNSGRPRRMFGTVQDITERRAKEAAEAANRAKDEFLANVSHEIRTPMNAILGMTELALDTPLTDDQRQCLRTVKSAADNLLGIINDLLDFSKIEAGKMELVPADFSLRAAVGDTLRALAARAHKKGIELISEVWPDVPDALVGDASRLRQVLLNLVGNAIKFTERGEVVVEVQRLSTAVTDATDEKDRRASSSASVLSVSSVDALRFCVRDTGIGIPKDQHERIFRAFEQEDASTTRKYGGTGLGLTIAARLVALMGGTITVESEPGRGSTFAFTARFGRQQHLPEPIPVQPPVLLQNLPVLVVDDNATNRHILQEWLHGWRMQPAAVGDAVAALDALRQAAARGRPYPLVLLDARMPDIDGLALAAQIRQHPELSAPRIILLSSGDRPGDLARARELRIDAHLLKPVQPDELLETIHRVMSRGNGDLPPAAGPAELEPTRAAVPAARPLRVLVAEDNEFNAQLLEQLLGRRGHRVRLANNGREALGLAGEGGFDLLLLDVHMPELDGFAVVGAIRERERTAGGHLPIIALTARSRQEDRERCLAAGMDDFLAKPIRAADLWAAIDRTVAARPPAEPPGPGLLDRQVLLAACGGDAAILEKIGQTFRARLPGHLKAAQDALREQDAPRLREAAHKLAGMVAAFSTVAGGVASELEDQAAQGRLEEARPLVARLETMAEELLRLVGGLSPEALREPAALKGPGRPG
jgi:PAS domain S-box-containing protein